MRKSNTLTHNHNYLMGTITFDIQPITPTSPRNTLAIILKEFGFFLLQFSLHIFLFEHSMHEHLRERKENTQYI